VNRLSFWRWVAQAAVGIVAALEAHKELLDNSTPIIDEELQLHLGLLKLWT